MSSLRRRAIWVQRAMSIARSSTGGRASARTTAPASLGSTSSRSHASRSRTSARWKNAAAPASRCGTARSSSATATAWPSLRTERTSTQMSSGATSSRATSRSISAATDCAWARSLSHCQNATSPPEAPVSSLAIRSGAGSATARAAARIRSGQRWLSSSRTTVVAGHSAWKSRRFLAAAPRRRWIAWSSSPAALIWPCSPASSRSSRHWAKFASCSSSTRTWRKRSPTRARTRGCVRSRRNASSTRSPKSRVPDSCSQRSWAA